MTGIQLAQDIGIVTKESQLSFAHDLANKVIANYSPSNRPEVFQGAIGTSIGLFQSFIQNYYQRMFRYTETKDWSSLAHSFIGQSSVFGVPHVPGWSLINGLESSLSNGEQDATGGLRHRFGGAADLLEGGALSNLFTLFGAPAADLYSRGDVNSRIPGETLFEKSDKSVVRQVAELSPAMSILGKLHDGISQGVQAFWNSHDTLTSTQIGEILSNTIPNRPISGMIEQFMAHGNDTDRLGQLVSDTHNAMESVYRIMGIRSMDQSKEIEAFYASKPAQEHQAALQASLRTSIRSAIREGRMDEFYDIFENQYVANGGDPRYFRRYVIEAQKAATQTRGERALERAMKNPARATQMQRLLEAGVPIGDDSKEAASGVDVFGDFAAPYTADMGVAEDSNQPYDSSLGQPSNGM
jgi:hypothetical protein